MKCQWFRRLFLVFAVLASILTIPVATVFAQAGEISVVVVGQEPSDRGTALRLSRALLKRLATSQALRPIEITEALDSEVSKFRKQDISDGLEAAKTGLAGLEQLDLELAGGDLDLAVNLLLGYVEHLSPEQRQVLDQSIFALATVSMFEGNTETADSIFVALALLSPAYTPETDGYASNVTKRYAQIRAGLEKRRTGSVEIISAPPGATVIVDGVYRGVSPVKIEGLVDGQHVVLLERMGFISHGTLTPVNASRNSRIEVDLAPTKATEILKPYEADLATSEVKALELGKKANLKKMLALMLRTTPAGPRAFGQWLDIENATRIAEIPETMLVKEPDIAATEILGALALQIDPFANKTDSERSQNLSGPPWISIEWKTLPQKWWFWAAVAGTVSAVAIGASLAVPEEEGLTVPQANQHILGF